ncbi:MAG: YidC/Oxa1 family membrane protein insertase [Clostridiales bacterium]|nr:YidC/Oxa1 family membrane protein insertase [Clostridiales bacterium]
MTDLSNSIFLLTRQIEPRGWAWLEPVSRGFGWVIDVIFNAIHSTGIANSLGIAIILMTIIFRFLIMPLHLKSQKSMMKMRELKPELDKIKEKYGNSKDPELMRKSQQEQSALLSKHGANPLSGCLPMLIQFPLFIALNTVMRQASLYITHLKTMYENLAAELLNIPGLVNLPNGGPGAIQQLAEGMLEDHAAIIPEKWVGNLHEFDAYLRSTGAYDSITLEEIPNAISNFGNNDIIILGLPEHLARVINKFNPADWEHIYKNITEPAQLQHIQSLVSELASIETFLGISIVEPSGWGLPGILIPIFTGISMFISSWLMQQRTYDPNADERTVITNKMMLTVMPVMMAFFTINFIAAVGVFWITGQIFQSIQDVIMLKKAGIPIRLPFVKPKPTPEVVDVVPTKKKKRK